MRMTFGRWAGVLFLALGAIGCGPPKVHVSWSRPPLFSLDKSKKIAVVVEAEGQAPPSATQVLDTVLGVTRGKLLNKWAAVPPLTNELKASLQEAGYTIVDSPARADVIVRGRPMEWHYALDKPTDFSSGVGRLDAVVEIYDARASGGPPLFGDSYWAKGAGREIGEPEAMLRASRRLSGVFVSNLFPTQVSATIVLDDSDPVVEPGIELCKQNQFDAAYEAFANAVERAPNSSAALYDLGVAAEIKGRYDEAESRVVQATKVNPKPIYFTALERIRGARQDAEGLKKN